MIWDALPCLALSHSHPGITEKNSAERKFLIFPVSSGAGSRPLLSDPYGFLQIGTTSTLLCLFLFLLSPLLDAFFRLLPPNVTLAQTGKDFGWRRTERLGSGPSPKPKNHRVFFEVSLGKLRDDPFLQREFFKLISVCQNSLPVTRFGLCCVSWIRHTLLLLSGYSN